MGDSLINWKQLILFVGVFQGIFLIIFLLGKGRNIKANYILATIIYLATVQMFLFSFDEVYDFLGCALTNIFSRLIFTVYGPLFYFYTRTYINTNYSWRSFDLIHFLPFSILAILSYWSYQTWDATNGEGWIHHIANTHMFAPIINDILRWTHLSIYLMLSVIYTKNKSTIFNYHFSNLDLVQVKWLVQFLVFAFAVWTFVALGLRLNYLTADPNKNSYQFLFLTISLFMYWVTYKSMSSPFILLGSQEVLTNKPLKNKYKNSNLTNEKFTEIEHRINQYMADAAPYLNADLNLEELSTALSISRYHISQTLNTHIGQNFYQFVNKYRVEAAKKKLRSESMSYITVEAIAYDCGFNSKSTFIKVFKNAEGITPGNYRNAKFS